jgi:hypothetical protein
MLSLFRAMKFCAAVTVTAVLLTGAPSLSYAQVTKYPGEH